MKIIEYFNQSTVKSDWKTQYIRYRLGRLKHQYWLLNRKSKDQIVIDSYDYSILRNCQPGQTVFFASAGYYLMDLLPDMHIVEMHPVVKTFYPTVIICEDRNNLTTALPVLADNFAVVNNRADQWCTIDERNQNVKYYTEIMNVGCRFFYSFRDTQIPKLNRLKIDMETYWLDWAHSLLESHGLKLVWSSIQFPKKQPDCHGNYDTLENPDTTNGNLKFWFVYQGDSWEIMYD
jgi:hypothetical protein